MLSALDEGIGNITTSLHAAGMYDNSVMVLSNDNGGMSGTYGLGCCNCGTSCGGMHDRGPAYWHPALSALLAPLTSLTSNPIASNPGLHLAAQDQP